MLIGAHNHELMTVDQKATYETIASGPRKGVPNPFLAMLDAPHIADAIQAVGVAIRFNSLIPDNLREIAILSAAGAFPSNYEWQYHAKIARNLSVDDIVIAATRTGKIDEVAEEIYRVIIQLVRRAVVERSVDDVQLARLVALVGRAVATEIIAIAGYYPLLALFLSAGKLEVQSGAA